MTNGVEHFRKWPIQLKELKRIWVQLRLGLLNLVADSICPRHDCCVRTNGKSTSRRLGDWKRYLWTNEILCIIILTTQQRRQWWGTIGYCSFWTPSIQYELRMYAFYFVWELWCKRCESLSFEMFMTDMHAACGVDYNNNSSRTSLVFKALNVKKRHRMERHLPIKLTGVKEQNDVALCAPYASVVTSEFVTLKLYHIPYAMFVSPLEQRMKLPI